jgi:RND superfamily putative drug exporter
VKLRRKGPRRRRRDRSAGSTPVTGLAGFVTRWPWLVVGIWIFAVVLLAFVGAGVERKLNAQVTYGDGTPAKRARDLVVSQFGGEDVMVVMLRGPQANVEEQGKALAKRFAHRPHTHVVSPWSGGGAAMKGLTPKPGVAAVIVRVEDPTQQVLNRLPPVQHQVDLVVREPVHASIAGLPALAESFREANNSAALVGQMVAFPVLLIVLLFVFRSALAAFMPLVVGGAVVAATRGLLSVFTGLLPIDLFAVGVAGMMGLALGVDYSLLVVSRFREEYVHGDLTRAVQVTMTRTARSILPAGGGLVLAMLVTPMLLTGTIARSVSIAVITVTLLSMISAMCVVPALLTLLGPNLDRWSFPKRRGSQVASLRWSRSLAAHPRAVVGIMAAMLVLAGLAFTLKTGVIAVEQLPADDSGRLAQEDVERGLGPGWVAPMEVVANQEDGPITTPKQLNELASFQRKAEADPGVVAVAGFGKVANKAKNLNSIEGNLVKQEKKIGKLAGGISKLHKGSAVGSTGLLAAAEGSKQLGAGIGATNKGAGVLAKALRAVSTGSGQLSEGLGKVNEGGDKLAEGTAKASNGAVLLANGLAKAKEKTGEIAGSARLFENAMRSGEDRLGELHAPLGATETQIETALRGLQRMTAGRTDSEYAAVLHAVEEASRRVSGKDPKTGEPDSSFEGIEAGIERADGQFGVGLYLAGRLGTAGGQAQEGIAKLAKGSAALKLGLRGLATGTTALSGGLAQLSEGGSQLPPVLVKLKNGAEQLEGGLGKLGEGAGKLSTGLGSGAQKSKLLTGALQKIKTALNQQAGGKGGSNLAQLR